jgi:hypothetical protein
MRERVGSTGDPSSPVRRGAARSAIASGADLANSGDSPIRALSSIRARTIRTASARLPRAIPFFGTIVSDARRLVHAHAGLAAQNPSLVRNLCGRQKNAVFPLFARVWAQSNCNIE